MGIDPRRLAVLQVELDVLAHEINAAMIPELNEAFKEAREAIRRSEEILKQRAMYLQVPDDYEPPEGLGGCSGSKPKSK
jgi:hypothetical protein